MPVPLATVPHVAPFQWRITLGVLPTAHTSLAANPYAPLRLDEVGVDPVHTLPSQWPMPPESPNAQMSFAARPQTRTKFCASAGTCDQEVASRCRITLPPPT